jgi:hypothetical protein
VYLHRKGLKWHSAILTEDLYMKAMEELS